MIYNSVADILTANDEVRGRVVARAEKLSAAEQGFHPGDGGRSRIPEQAAGSWGPRDCG